MQHLRARRPRALETVWREKDRQRSLLSLARWSLRDVQAGRQRGCVQREHGRFSTLICITLEDVESGRELRCYLCGGSPKTLSERNDKAGSTLLGNVVSYFSDPGLYRRRPCDCGAVARQHSNRFRELRYNYCRQAARRGAAWRP